MKTSDGRDLSAAEWRKLPEFPKYQITRDGDIRNTRTGRLLNELQNSVTGAWAYHLTKTLPNGKYRNYTRNYKTLIASAYPEGS